MEKIKAKAIENLEKLGKAVHKDCDACLGVQVIVVAILFLLVIV